MVFSQKSRARLQLNAEKQCLPTANLGISSWPFSMWKTLSRIYLPTVQCLFSRKQPSVLIWRSKKLPLVLAVRLSGYLFQKCLHFQFTCLIPAFWFCFCFASFIHQIKQFFIAWYFSPLRASNQVTSQSSFLQSREEKVLHLYHLQRFPTATCWTCTWTSFSKVEIQTAWPGTSLSNAKYQ